ncbi:MAG: site-specific DNA-methyltransferase [Phycisphaerales bacterium]|nr:site-specific DNA-methyltransferase [Phycisphaerales bacterium]
MLDIYLGDNLDILPGFPDGSFDLIYIDPPFNTGKTQGRTRIKTVRDETGDRTGFQGARYQTIRLGNQAFADVFDDFLAFLEPRLRQAYRLLAPTGSFFLHIDYREVHYCKVLLDQIFGRESFLNEIIWAYDYGARAKRRWSPKHDNILWYAKNPTSYTYRYDAIDRIPYMAPGLVGPEKAAKGKTPTDTWWNTIVSPTGKEKTGYPTQKPLAIMNRIINVHTNPGDRVLDFFAGSGTTGEAAARAGREAVLIDESKEAVEIMSKRLAFAKPRVRLGQTNAPGRKKKAETGSPHFAGMTGMRAEDRGPESQNQTPVVARWKCRTNCLAKDSNLGPAD